VGETTILVVDDEDGIRSSLKGILSDEGFAVFDSGDSSSALTLIDQLRPRLVLLDVWMPEVDGIELLRKIKQSSPQTDVIMISGHGNIQSAVTAIKLGAADFIEKPFSVEHLLNTIARVLADSYDADWGAQKPKAAISEGILIQPGSFPTLRQKTINRSAVLAGQGLHSGLKTGVILYPGPLNSGIVFMPLSSDVTIFAKAENVSDTGYNTTLSYDGYSVRTIEHLMSALHGFGITNLLIKTEGEVPALDGSAVEFCKAIAEVGVREQDGFIAPVQVKEPILIGDSARRGKYILVEPADRLIIDYTLEYPPPIGTQRVHFELTSPEDYMREIAPARTFGFVTEMSKLSAMGLARGGRLDNCILVDNEKVINTALRYDNEFARHKVLDLIGDLYLLGRPLWAHVTAYKTGHSDNLALVRALWQQAAREYHQ